MSGWSDFYFNEKLKSKTEEIASRKTLLAIKKKGLPEDKAKLGLMFSAELAGRPIAGVDSRLLKKGQIFLSQDGKLSAIIQRKKVLAWIDISDDGRTLNPADTIEAITEAIDLSGEWMLVANSGAELITQMKDGVLGCPEEMRKQWGQTT